MKTVLIQASPKKRGSASAYLTWLQSIMLTGSKVRETLRTRGDHARIMEAVRDADHIVFCLPMYIDSLPAHVIPFLQELEDFCRTNGLQPKIYVISNGGFIEGNQNRVVMQIMENFCARAGLTFGGGVGVGGGVMMNVTRILLMVQAALCLLKIVLGGWQNAGVFLLDLLERAGVILFFQAGVLVCIGRMGMCMSRGRNAGVRFTRILLPSFVFILVADVFFTVVSLFQGGLFRGWLAKK